MVSMTMEAQEKIVNPEVSYAAQVRSCYIGALRVSGVEDYEEYMLTSISGLTVGQHVSVPGSEITEAVSRYWKH